jgi:hypothetical protein
VQLSFGFSELSLRERNALLVSDLKNIGQALRTQIAQLKENVSVFRDAVRLLKPTAK